jgi:hypothetical protein
MWSLQVVTNGKELLQLSTPNISGSFIVGGTNTMSCESEKAGQSAVNSKGFFIFSTVDASSMVDFSRTGIHEGVLDSPPPKDNGQIPRCSPSPCRKPPRNKIYRSLCSEWKIGTLHL